MESMKYGGLCKMEKNVDGLVNLLLDLAESGRLTVVSLPHVVRFQRPRNYIYLSSGEHYLVFGNSLD